MDSKLTKAYKTEKKKYMGFFTRKFKEMIKDLPKPYKIGFYFVRDSRRRFDYINACQVLADLMQEKEIGWIEDDDSLNIIPVFLGSEVDKNNAGVYITVIPEKEWLDFSNKYLVYL